MAIELSRRSFLAGTGLAAASMLAACGGSTTTDGAGSAAATTAAVADDYALVTEGKLTVISELGFAPFEYLEGEEVVGFDYDMSVALAEKLGLEAEWLPNQAFDTLVPTIKQGGKADVAIAGITITDERLAEIDFSDPYLDSNQAIVVKAGSGETSETLNDASKTVACQSGTTGDDWIAENLPEATRVPLADVTAAEMGVSTGSYDAFVIDLPVASNDITNSFTDLEVAEEIPTGEQYGIVISKDNPNLTTAINDALAEMVADGTMADIKTKWFGSDI